MYAANQVASRVQVDSDALQPRQTKMSSMASPDEPPRHDVLVDEANNSVIDPDIADIEDLKAEFAKFDTGNATKHYPNPFSQEDPLFRINKPSLWQDPETTWQEDMTKWTLNPFSPSQALVSQPNEEPERKLGKPLTSDSRSAAYLLD